VIIEHFFYSAALAVLVGMIYFRFAHRDPSWIIIAISFVPDIDHTSKLLRHVFWPFMFRPYMHSVINSGDFHSILFLIVFSLLFGAILRGAGFRFIDGVICTAIGLAAHFFEDALVYKIGYAFFWPISSKIYGLGIIPETYNLWIADSTVLIVGIILLASSVVIRTFVDGKGWWDVFLQGGRLESGHPS
jgi:membrane-bound metal-dependent hydrolase YbcI (DUF457 family)